MTRRGVACELAKLESLTCRFLLNSKSARSCVVSNLRSALVTLSLFVAQRGRLRRRPWCSRRRSCALTTASMSATRTTCPRGCRCGTLRSSDPFLFQGVFSPDEANNVLLFPVSPAIAVAHHGAVATRTSRGPCFDPPFPTLHLQLDRRRKRTPSTCSQARRRSPTPKTA